MCTSLSYHLFKTYVPFSFILFVCWFFLVNSTITKKMMRKMFRFFSFDCLFVFICAFVKRFSVHFFSPSDVDMYKHNVINGTMNIVFFFNFFSIFPFFFIFVEIKSMNCRVKKKNKEGREGNAKINLAHRNQRHLRTCLFCFFLSFLFSLQFFCSFFFFFDHIYLFIVIQEKERPTSI